MPQTALRSQLLRLALQDDKLRPALVRVLKAHGGLSEQETRALWEAQYPAAPQPPQPPQVQVVPAPPVQPVPVQPVLPLTQPQAPSSVQPVPVQPVLPPAQPQAPSMVQAPVAPQQPIIIQQQPMVVQQAPPVVAPSVGALPMLMPASQPLGALLVTERTQQGFEHDLLPEMERLLASGRTHQQVAAEILAMIDVAFQQKDLLYNILIRHQSTFESDAVYRESLERLVQAWVADAVESGG